MMQARFMENPICLLSLKGSTPECKSNDYVVVKVIEISPHDYNDYCGNLADSYTMITDNAKLTYIDNCGAYHCLLITISGSTEGVLVESGESGSIRNTAFWEYRDKSAASALPHIAGN